MIATDAHVSRILIARQTDSYLPGDVTVQKGFGAGGGVGGGGIGAVGQGTGKNL